MKNIIFLLFLLIIGKVYSTDSLFYFEEYEKLYNFLQLEIPIQEFDICENVITKCNENEYISYLEFDICWNEGNYNPKDFPLLSQLKNLVLFGSYNNTCKTNKKFSEIIFKLPSLENIFFVNVKDSDIPENINLESPIKNIEIKSSDLNIFPTQLAKLKNLNLLRITQSNIGQIPSEFAEFPSLKELELDNNKYGDKKLVIPNTIKYLDVSNEGFTSILKDDFNKNLMALICDNEKVENNEINSSNDYYNFKELKSVINFEEDVNSNKEFYSISNSINKSNESNPQFLLDNVSNSESFKSNGNNFDENIFNNITNYKNLQFLYLDNNNLIKKIPPSIKELTSLKLLKLNYENIDEVSEEFFKHPNLKKRFVLKNEDSNTENISLFEKCNPDEKEKIPCFDYNNEAEKHIQYLKIGGAILIAIIILSISYITFNNYRKRSKFEKMRKRIIKNVTNEIEGTSTGFSHNTSSEFHENVSNRQNSIVNSHVNLGSTVSCDIRSDPNELDNNSVTVDSNVNTFDNNNDAVNTNVNTIDNNSVAIDVNDDIPLPTYMESIITDLKVKITNEKMKMEMLYPNINYKDEKNSSKNSTENIVDAEVLEQTTDEYYARVRRVPGRNNSTNSNSSSIHDSNTEYNHRISEGLFENEKKQVEEDDKKQAENIVNAEVLVQTRDEYYSRVGRPIRINVNTTNSSNINNTENDQIIAETINEKEEKQDIKKGNLEVINNEHVNDTEPLPSYESIVNESERNTEYITLENTDEQNSSNQNIDITSEIEDNQKELQTETETETSGLNTQSILDETNNNTEIIETTNVLDKNIEEAKTKAEINKIMRSEPINLEKLDSLNNHFGFSDMNENNNKNKTTNTTNKNKNKNINKNENINSNEGNFNTLNSLNKDENI